MVPLRLQLQNFLSYGEDVPPLELAGLGTVCLSGANGHGKSALLEAIGWALWGEARKGLGPGRGQAGLVRQGRSELWVVLDFEHEGRRYRVRRAWRAGARGGKQELDLLLWDPAADVYRNLTCPTIAATEQRIRDEIRMDWDTFVNSAYLMQGRANEFSMRRPAERKQILGEILGLSRYDQLRDLARRKASEADQEVTATERQAAALEADLAGAEATRTAWQEAQQQSQQASDAASAAEQVIAALREQVAADEQQRVLLQAWEQQQRQADEALADLHRAVQEAQAAVADAGRLADDRERVRRCCERLADLEARSAELTAQGEQRRHLQAEQHRLQTDLRSLERDHDGEVRRGTADLERLLAQRAQTDEVLGRRERIRQQLAARQTARERLRLAEQQEGRWRALQEHLQAVERRVEKARTELETEQRQAAERVRVLRPQAAAEADLRARAAALQEALAAAAAAGEQALQLEARRVELTVRFQRLKAIDEQLQARRDELREHAAILARGGGVCPVCGTQLTPGRQAAVSGDYDARVGELQDEANANRTAGRELKREVAGLEAQLAELQSQASATTRLSREGGELERQISAAQQAAAEAAQWDERSRDLKSKLAAGDYGGDDLQTLRRLRRELGELDYHPDQLAELRRAVDRDPQIDRDGLRLEQAEEDHRRLSAELPALRSRLAELHSTRRDGLLGAAERALLAQVETALESLPDQTGELAALQRELRELRGAPALLEQCEAAAARLPSEQQRLAELRQKVAERDLAQRELTVQIDQGRGQLLDREALRRDLSAAAAVLDETRGRAHRWLAETGRLQEAVTRQQRQASELAELTARLGELRQRRDIQLHLVTAFGRDGIPALIIENAVPEIEAAANEVLALLSGGRLFLQIRLQKPLVAGGERETLEIDISDELGTRSYENYSGGEAFRVDFALRLALSRLLVGRAGARLRTLIIDEGFGTQDEDGIEQLVEAIQAISGTFDLVLVVTHLAALKDRFPTRIEVFKEAERGSTFSIVREAG
ncbi:MAG: SMC family ATPase [Fimbriimonadaceae bacterium]|nr:SMC family ATPase [Fimbriimonadaceae bacterium]